MNIIQLALLALAITMSLRFAAHLAVANGMVSGGRSWIPGRLWWIHFAAVVASIVASAASFTGLNI